jgi:hypothetical protein
MNILFACVARLNPLLALAVCALCSTGLVARGQLLNGDFSAGRTNFVSDYRFDPNASYVPGYFTIQTNSQTANYNYVRFGDHTTGLGYMLLADGNTNADKAVWSESVATATHTAYLFSAWAASSDAQSPAVLRFSANGIPLGPDLQLTADAGHWQQFIVTWNSETNGQITLSVVDTNLAYVGNDFALDDLAFTPLTNVVSNLRVYTAVELGWEAQTGSIYQVQYSTSLNPAEWINLSTPLQSTQAADYFLDSTRGQPKKFYRVLKTE